MNLKHLLSDPAWDAPFYKRLAHNDTGQAAGHQAGFVLPNELRKFLPSMSEDFLSDDTPTTDRYLNFEIYIDGIYQEEIRGRYQFQTWHGTRSPESRITDIGNIHNQAVEDDFLIMQRNLDSFDRFRMILVSRKSSDYKILENDLSKRWGILESDELPLSQRDLKESNDDIHQQINTTFQLIEPNEERIRSNVVRMARSHVFRIIILDQYQSKCSVSSISLISKEGINEVQAAHVVPKNAGGTDDPRNGLCLTGTLHWAFDNGLFGIDSERRVKISSRTLQNSRNDYLKTFNLVPITESKNKAYRVEQEALDWHMHNVGGL